jgi:anti-sigma factor RsiW
VHTHAVHLLVGAYALDSLGEPELVEFEDHLGTCDDCRTAVAGMREAVVLLAASVELAPPAGLRARVARDIARVRPLPPQPAVRDGWP